MVITQDDAEAIAKKLDCTFSPGKAHKYAELFEAGRLVVRFGIRRASKEKGHGHIPKELHITHKQCWDFRRCSLTKDGYFALLREKQLL